MQDAQNSVLELSAPMIFVFGSNTGGHHGAGAARIAVAQYGARWGEGEGLFGRSYALPTVEYRNARAPRRFRLVPMDPSIIKVYVDNFIAYANEHPHMAFKVTQVGCGLAGGKAADIAPMFADAPDNCYFDTAWRKFLPDKKFWGTF